MEEWPVCNHETTDYRRMTCSNGRVIHVRQCLDCGDNMGAIARAHVRSEIGTEDVPPFDTNLRDSTQQRRVDFYARKREEYEAERAARKTDWWIKYKAHLASRAWEVRRKRVLERDGYICQGCQKNRATQVHHLTYRRIGAEMLFDLVAICKPCHDAVHPRETDDTIPE